MPSEWIRATGSELPKLLWGHKNELMNNTHGFNMIVPRFWNFREKIIIQVSFQFFVCYNSRHLHESELPDLNLLNFVMIL